MYKIILILVILAFGLSAQAQSPKRYVDLEATYISPYNGQVYYYTDTTKDTIYLDAIVKNNGPDTLYATDSIAFIAFSLDGNLEIVVNYTNNPYAVIFSGKQLLPGDTMHAKAPFILAGGMKTFHLDMRVYTDSFRQVFMGHIAGVGDTTYHNNTKKITINTIHTSVSATAEAQSAVIAYPNPVTNEIHFHIPEIKADEAMIVISDMAGKIIKSGVISHINGQGSLNIEGVPAGLYVYKIRSGEKDYIGRLNKL